MALVLFEQMWELLPLRDLFIAKRLIVMELIALDPAHRYFVSTNDGTSIFDNHKALWNFSFSLNVLTLSEMTHIEIIDQG